MAPQIIGDGTLRGMAKKKVEHASAKGSFLTLEEVAAFVEDARRSGAVGAQIVHATVSFGGKLQKLVVDVENLPSTATETTTAPGPGAHEPYPGSWPTEAQMHAWHQERGLRVVESQHGSYGNVAFVIPTRTEPLTDA
jgi:hypothetical protein